MDRLPQLSNEDQLYYLSKVKNGEMSIDQVFEHVKQKEQANQPGEQPSSPSGHKRESVKKKEKDKDEPPTPTKLSFKKKGSTKSATFFFGGGGGGKDIPSESISSPIRPIDVQTGVPQITAEQDIRKKGDEERLKILDLVKNHQMTIEDAVKYCDDAGLLASAEREADTIADTTSAVLEQKVYNFPVYKAGKVRSQVRRILQIDFKNRTISSIQRGNVSKKHVFSETTGYETDEGVHFTIQFKDDHDMDYDADSSEERYEICRLISIILKLNNADIRTEQDYWRELPRMQAVMKEGELEKKGGTAFTVWNKRWVRVRRGECSYYRPGEQTALNIVQLAEGSTAITKVDGNGFILIGKVKQYVFRVPAGERSIDQQRWERDQWIKALLEASHNEVVRPLGGQPVFIRSDDDTQSRDQEPARDHVAAVAANDSLQRIRDGLHWLAKEMAAFNVTDDVMSQLDTLLGLTTSLTWTSAGHNYQPAPVENFDYKRPSRFIPPETDPSYSVPGEPTPAPEPAEPTQPEEPKPAPPKKPPRKSDPYAQRSIDSILREQGIDPTPVFTPKEPEPDEPDEDSAPEPPAKKSREPSQSSQASTQSSGSNDSGGYKVPMPLSSSPREGLDIPPVAAPRQKKLSATPKVEPIVENEESKPSASPLVQEDDDAPVLREKIRLSTVVPLQDPAKKLSGREEEETTGSRRHDVEDGRVSDVVHEIEEREKMEEEWKRIEEAKQSMPHKLSTTETPDEVIIVQAPPPAPMLPAPPPPPGLGFFSSSKKIKSSSKVKLKAIHWDKVPKNLYNKSMWKKAGDLTDSIDHTLLEEMFVDEKITASKADPTGSALGEKKLRTLLDAKRAQNLGIVLNGLKMTGAELQDKLQLVREEDGALPLEQIAMLRRLQPTPDDIEMYRAYKGNPKELEKADQFLMELGDIPQLGIRLDVLNDIMELPVQYKDMEPSVISLEKALTELLEAKQFVRVLEYILAIGNYVNSGAGKPAVDGVQLMSLNKLADSRGRDKKYSLLHYLVQFLSEKEPELLHFYTDLSHINECSDLSIAGLSAEVEVMKNYLSKIQKKSKSLKKIRSSALENRFQQDVHSFVLEYEKLLKLLSDRCNDVQSKFKKALEFYGEPSDRSCEDLFPALSRFLSSYQRTLREHQTKHKASAPAKALANVLFKVPPNQAMLKKNTSPEDQVDRAHSPAQKPDKPTKDGYLDKLSGGKHFPVKWDRRFFEVSANGYLEYYKKQFEKNQGSIYLKDCTVTLDPDESNVIVLETEDRDFKLRAKSANEADDWFNTLVFYSGKK